MIFPESRYPLFGIMRVDKKHSGLAALRSRKARRHPRCSHAGQYLFWAVLSALFSSTEAGCAKAEPVFAIKH